MGTTAIVFFLVWSALGVAAAGLLARRGHNFWVFAAIGIAYGPFTALIAWVAHRDRRTQPIVYVDGSQWHADGEIDVVVGLDGSEAAVEAVGNVIGRLSPAIRSVHLASVVDYEVGDSVDSFRTDDERLAHLQHAAQRLGIPEAELVLLSGQPHVAIEDHAMAHGLDMIVVGRGTRPIARRLLGSTSGELARRAERAVVVAPTGVG